MIFFLLDTSPSSGAYGLANGFNFESTTVRESQAKLAAAQNKIAELQLKQGIGILKSPLFLFKAFFEIAIFFDFKNFLQEQCNNN